MDTPKPNEMDLFQMIDKLTDEHTPLRHKVIIIGAAGYGPNSGVVAEGKISRRSGAWVLIEGHRLIWANLAVVGAVEISVWDPDEIDEDD